MAEAPESVLVYTRIAANERKTRWLVAAFVVVLMPVVSAATTLAMPVITAVIIMVAARGLGPEQIFQRLMSIDVEVQAAQPSDGVMQLRDLPASFVWLTGGFLAVALIVVAIGFGAVTVFLVWRYGTRMLLRAVHARPVSEGEEPDLVRLVQNLCIGAGLPTPRVYVVESRAPNAFATGRHPNEACLVVTRGLLTLVNRRELQGVIAHELSHIGNHDTRLTMILAALVGTTSLPWKVALAPVRYAFRTNPVAGACSAFFFICVGWLLLNAFWSSLIYLASDELSQEVPPFMWWWIAHTLVAPVYALWVAPIASLVIRQAVSREREFLADADAVRLTRDPEGLALALAKIGAAGGERLRVGEGSVHLCIVDPHGGGSLLHRVFPSHPPVVDRLQLLAKMGSGLPEAALEAAIEAGRQLRQTSAAESESAALEKPSEQQVLAPTEGEDSTEDNTNGAHQPARSSIPLYEHPDGWSKVLAQLDENAALTPVGKVGNFVRVVTSDNVTGYVSASACLSALRQGSS